MSIQLTESERSTLPEIPFPNGKNIRVKITGLALCKFTERQSTIRFLRHVKHHELLMKITQINKMNTAEKKTFAVKIGPSQNVVINGSTMTDVGSHIHPPTAPEESFDNIIKMLADYLHNNRPLENRTRLPSPAPTTLTLNRCAFYTHKLTEKNYQFEDLDTTPKPTIPRRFCEILGGYLSYTGTLTISILSDGLPLTFPLDNFLYEIEFSNSCDTTPGCIDEEDFRFIYDIVRERNDLGRVFKLIEAADRSINTGACLPVSEDGS